MRSKTSDRHNHHPRGACLRRIAKAPHGLAGGGETRRLIELAGLKTFLNPAD